MIIEVLVELSTRSVDKTFDYLVPPQFVDKIQLGIRVLVPFGMQKLEGFVLKIKNLNNSKYQIDELKEILDVVDEEVILNEELLKLGKKISEMTLSTLISSYQVMLPEALKARKKIKINKKIDIYMVLNKNIEIPILKNENQQKIVDLLKRKKRILKQELNKISSSSVKTLMKNNILLEEKIEHYRVLYKNEKYDKKELSSDQRMVVNEVINNSRNIYLLHGVTGSGKTEVYMEIIEHYLSLGKTSIVLVPEISLTPQMVSRFQQRFGEMIAAIHSALSDGEKYDEWRRICRGEARIVIGARSAIFAPLKNIGVIIIDEEHSDSYKQSDPNPRYSAKDVAIIRSEYHNCPVIFGSATPSLEVMARACKGVYKLLSLPNRVNGKKLPLVKIVDMNEEMKKTQGYFSNILIESIRHCLEKKEQVILLLNRRGYSSFVSCKNCGYTFKCPNCDITLTFHKSSNTLRCHYCGYG